MIVDLVYRKIKKQRYRKYVIILLNYHDYHTYLYREKINKYSRLKINVRLKSLGSWTPLFRLKSLFFRDFFKFHDFPDFVDQKFIIFQTFSGAIFLYNLNNYFHLNMKWSNAIREPAHRAYESHLGVRYFPTREN